MSYYYKAIVGALTAGVGALITGAIDGHLTLQEWLLAIAASLATLGGVYATRNTGTKRAKRTR